ncbi:MAG: hypothetical protein EGQ20_07125 [Bacteroides oleiciplenus]|nr:hypothetical protein [Bacteroides oleiciplenus]
MKDKSISFIISIISIYVFMHYYFTLDVLWEYLRDYNLNIVSIISWEDVQFSIASVNSELFIEISLLLLIPFIVIKLFIHMRDSIISNIIICNANNLKKKIECKVTKWQRIINVDMTLALMASVILIIIVSIKENWITAILILLMLLIAIVYYHYRNYIIVFSISMFVFTKVTYDNIIKEGKQLYGNDIKIELNDGKIVQSDSINKLIFFGTKYIILENDSPNVKLYPTDKIKEIEWINKRKINQTDTIKATL